MKRKMHASMGVVGMLALAGMNQASADFAIGFPFGLPEEVVLNNCTHHDWQVFLTEGGGHAGSMFYSPKQNVQNGFQTTFRFTVTPGNVVAGDGFAFVIQNQSVNALGAGGSDIGYGGIQNGVAIEFDTFYFQGEFEGMHVSVQGPDENGELSASDTYSYGHYILDPDNGDPSIIGTHEGHIEYTPPSGPNEGEMRVYLDNHLVLTTIIDLGDVNGTTVYDANGETFVGFTAGTGLADSSHSIESWAFFGDTNGDCYSPGGFIGFWGGCGVGCLEFAGVTVTGSRAMTYEWYKDDVLITSDDGGRITGLGTSEIVVNDFTIEDRGNYRVQITNSCGTLDGGTYPLGGPPCDSIDFNNDTSLFDPQDIDAFLSVYSEGPCIPDTATCNDIDFNNDGSLFDPCDIDSFLLQFSEGPCTLCGV
ncbi:MAG: hypothetical protein U0640_04130 [Phycisphaerales bacterium]